MLGFGQIFMRNSSSWEPTGPIQHGPVLRVLSTEALFLSAFPQSSVCAHHHVCSSAHMVQFPVKGSFFFPEKGAVIRWKSWNSDCWVTVPWPSNSPWPGKSVGTSRFLVFLFSAPPISLSPALWDTFQRSPTQTLTQALCSYFFPRCTQYINIPSSFIGRAGW